VVAPLFVQAKIGQALEEWRIENGEWRMIGKK
jgi:hypothetical protein